MIVNFIVLLLETIIAYFVYERLAGTYQHPGMIFLVFLLVFIYFVPTFIALYKKHKYTLQIAILNFFLGFTLLGWIGALIWSTLKTEKDENLNEIFIFISIHIFMIISLISFCITDHYLFNTEKILQQQREDVQQTIDSIKTLQEYYRNY